MRVRRRENFGGFRLRVQEQLVLVSGDLLAGEWLLGRRRCAQRRRRYGNGFGGFLVVLSGHCALRARRIPSRCDWLVWVRVTSAPPGRRNPSASLACRLDLRAFGREPQS